MRSKSIGPVRGLPGAGGVLLFVILSLTTAVGSATAAAAPGPRTVLAEATFAGGCFWCVEAAFEKIPGVISVTSGYTGGKKIDPTYEDVGRGGTGHAEAVRIVFDPRKTSYTRLLDVFWHNIDPTQADGQFCDIGDPYRSVIFHHDETQRRLAEQSRQRIAASGRLERPIVTPIVAAGPFYPAEDYHQDFYKKDPIHYKAYRFGCGRDRRLAQLWGKDAKHGRERSATSRNSASTPQ